MFLESFKADNTQHAKAQTFKLGGTITNTDYLLELLFLSKVGSTRFGNYCDKPFVGSSKFKFNLITFCGVCYLHDQEF